MSEQALGPHPRFRIGCKANACTQILYGMCIFVGDAGNDGEEEGDDVSIVAPPPKKSLSVKPKRKVKGRGGKKGGAKRGRKGATAAARRVTPIPILEEKEGKLHNGICF